MEWSFNPDPVDKYSIRDGYYGSRFPRGPRGVCSCSGCFVGFVILAVVFGCSALGLMVAG